MAPGLEAEAAVMTGTTDGKDPTLEAVVYKMKIDKNGEPLRLKPAVCWLQAGGLTDVALPLVDSRLGASGRHGRSSSPCR